MSGADPSCSPQTSAPPVAGWPISLAGRSGPFAPPELLGIPELSEHFAAGVTHVLSILGPNSLDPPEFAAFASRRRLILRFP
jgi:hypothetical protein